jgi:hypothetical protein
MRALVRIPIDEVAIDSTGRLLVRPRIAATEDFGQIYRTASGVRWESASRSLVPYEAMDKAPPWWFRQIVDAVQSEYRQLLELQPDTIWTNVPAETRRDIQSGNDGHDI